VDRLLGEHAIPRDSAAGREQFEKRMEWRRASEDGAEFKPIERGWLLGSEAFRKELLAQMSERRGPEHYGPEVRESGLDKAQRLVGEELRQVEQTVRQLYRARNAGIIFDDAYGVWTEADQASAAAEVFVLFDREEGRSAAAETQ